MRQPPVATYFGNDNIINVLLRSVTFLAFLVDCLLSIYSLGNAEHHGKYLRPAKSIRPVAVISHLMECWVKTGSVLFPYNWGLVKDRVSLVLYFSESCAV